MKRYLKICTVALILSSSIFMITGCGSEKKEDKDVNQIVSEEKNVTNKNNAEKDGKLNNWDDSKVNICYDKNNIPVPVPKGYTASSADGENSVSTGFVIYEGNEKVTNNNLEKAQTNRNQWVWIPVKDINEIYGVDNSNKKIGKLYESYNNTTKRLAYNWNETNKVINILSLQAGREPDLLNDCDNDDNLKNFLDANEINHLLNIQSNFDDIIKSIDNYGGFYIGRYETGNLSSTASIVKGNTDIANQNWYKMYSQCLKLSESNKNVSSCMIYGCLWDATLNWLVESENKTYDEIGHNSNTWGNYYYPTFSYTDSTGENRTKATRTQVLLPTGASEHNKANNIYDLAGNVYDWTLTAAGSNYRWARGSDYYESGSSATADDTRAFEPTRSALDTGCRAMMYIEM